MLPMVRANGSRCKYPPSRVCIRRSLICDLGQYCFVQLRATLTVGIRTPVGNRDCRHQQRILTHSPSWPLVWGPSSNSALTMPRGRRRVRPFFSTGTLRRPRQANRKRASLPPSVLSGWTALRLSRRSRTVPRLGLAKPFSRWELVEGKAHLAHRTALRPCTNSCNHHIHTPACSDVS